MNEKELIQCRGEWVGEDHHGRPCRLHIEPGNSFLEFPDGTRRGDSLMLTALSWNPRFRNIVYCQQFNDPHVRLVFVRAGIDELTMQNAHEVFARRDEARRKNERRT